MQTELVFVALAEMKRAKVRFGLLIAAIGMLVFMILFQQSLQGGLLTSFVGAIRHQTAPVLAYSVDGQRVIQSSVITPDLETLIRTTDGVAAAGRIGQGTFSVDTADHGRFDTTILGYETLGAPTTLVEGRLPERVGEAVASDVDADLGFAVGEVVTIEPGGERITIVGSARDVQLNAGPTLFTTYDGYLSAVHGVNPDAREPLPNVIALSPVEGVTPAELATAVNARSVAVDALVRDEAAAETPGVAQVRQSFQVIFVLYGLVVPCVTGLFFLIVTFQKSASLTLLRAIGAPAGRLVQALLFQALLIMLAGLVLGIAIYTPVSRLRIGQISLRFETAAVIGWSVALVALGVGSALFAARRVLRIDPVEATVGGGHL